MTTPTNPFEIARETLKLLAARRTPPTPDNYLTIYHEISVDRRLSGKAAALAGQRPAPLFAGSAAPGPAAR